MTRHGGLRAGLACILLACAAASASAQGPGAPAQAFSAAPGKAAITTVMSAVADWQLANP